MNKHDAQVVSSVLWSALYDDSPPDYSQLEHISLEGLAEFTSILFGIMKNLFPERTMFPEAIRELAEGQIEQYRKEIRPALNDTFAFDYRYVQNTTRKMKDYFHLLRKQAGWKKLTDFFKEDCAVKYNAQLLNPAKEIALAQLRHEHPILDDDGLQQQLQRNWVAREGNLIQIGPPMQDLLKELINEHNFSSHGALTEAKSRKDWRPLEHVMPYPSSSDRIAACSFLDARWNETAQEHQKTHGCSPKEAEQHANDTYMYRFPGRSIWRVLSPQAQQDLQQHVKTHSHASRCAFTEAKSRKDWRPPQHIMSHLSNSNRKTATSFLDARRDEVAQTYRKAHDCSLEEAQQHANDTYMYRSPDNSARHVLRVLGPQAREDLQRYLAGRISQSAMDRLKQSNNHEGFNR